MSASHDLTEVPTNIYEWREYVRDSKNRPAAIARLINTLYREPIYDIRRIGAAARKVGGYERLIQLLWIASANPPFGDVLSYVEGTARKGAKNNGKALNRTRSVNGVEVSY